MRIVKDGDGREWAFSLNVYEFKRLRPQFGDLLDPRLFFEKTDDAVSLVDILFALVSQEAEKRKIDADAFARSFYGDFVADAKTALRDEYRDFFPTNVREYIGTTFANVEMAKEKYREAMMKRQETAKAEAMNAANESPNLPESSESTPTL